MWNAISLVVLCAKPPSQGTHQRRDSRSLSQCPIPTSTAHQLIGSHGLRPATRGHDAIMTVVDRFSKRGMFILYRKDMIANNLIYTTLSTWSMCVLSALLLCCVIHRWHVLYIGGMGCITATCTQCSHSAKTWLNGSPLNSPMTTSTSSSMVL